MLSMPRTEWASIEQPIFTPTRSAWQTDSSDVASFGCIPSWQLHP
jgi:hypothetical protein